MAAYVVLDLVVTDPDGYAEYARKVVATMEHFGGKSVIIGKGAEPLEGDWRPNRLVALQFPDFDAAKAWYTSPEYQEILPIRLRSAKTEFLTLIDSAV